MKSIAWRALHALALAVVLPCQGLAASPFIVILGTVQDGGFPQAGSSNPEAWNAPGPHRFVTCLGLVDPESGERWMVEATPDFKYQLRMLDETTNRISTPPLSGIFLTHAHVGHYAGLINLGLEIMGSRQVPVYALPRMREFLARNGPWSQLVSLGNIELRPVEPEVGVRLNDRLEIVSFLVPHRQEYSEVAGLVIKGPSKSVLFLPDVDRWEQLASLGTGIEGRVSAADLALLDGTFFSANEVPGRDMSDFPHPLMEESLERFGKLPLRDRKKILFIHLNHTNPALLPGTKERRRIEESGMGIAREGERIEL